MRESVIAHAEQFLSSESDEVRYRATLLIEVLRVTATFDNEVIAIEKRDSVAQEIAQMNDARKEMSSLNEKADTPGPAESDSEINLSAAIETGVADAPEEPAAQETPREETPVTPVAQAAPQGIHQLSELLERFTAELLPVSAKAQRKVKKPEGLDLDTPLASFDLDKPIEAFRTVSFVDGPLFSYESAEPGRVGSAEGRPAQHRHHKGHRSHRREKNEFYLDAKEEEEGSEDVPNQELTLEDVGVPVVIGEAAENAKENAEEPPATQFQVIRDEEDDDSEEEAKPKEKGKDREGSGRHHGHRSHRHRKNGDGEGDAAKTGDAEAEEKPKEEGGHRHRRHHH